jgi:hypothetical protein
LSLISVCWRKCVVPLVKCAALPHLLFVFLDLDFLNVFCVLLLSFFFSLSLSFIFCNSIQYMRHLHDKVQVLETRTAPPKEEETDAAAEAAAMGYGMSNMMGNDTLMIGYGGGGAGGYGYAPSQNGGIPDPYAQQQAPQMNFGGQQQFGGAAGGYY